MTDSTDNARGPERIWVCPDLIVEENGEKTPDWSCGTFWEGDEPDYPYGQFYVRADLAPDPLRAVRVKPLEWKAHNEIGHGRVHYGSGAFDHWYAVSRVGRNSWECMTFIGGKRRGLGEHPTLEAAKAAAQADYEARILSALEPADVMADPRVGLTQAATIAETIMQKHAKAHYSGEAVRVFKSGDDTLSESAAKAYCAGEILEAIHAALAALSPDPLGAVNVRALVEFFEWVIRHKASVLDGMSRREQDDFTEMLGNARAALAALSPTGGNADG